MYSVVLQVYRGGSKGRMASIAGADALKKRAGGLGAICKTEYGVQVMALQYSLYSYVP